MKVTIKVEIKTKKHRKTNRPLIDMDIFLKDFDFSISSALTRSIQKEIEHIAEYPDANLCPEVQKEMLEKISLELWKNRKYQYLLKEEMDEMLST